MADNTYSTLVERLADELGAGLTQYPGLVITKRVFRAAALPSFDTYAIIISPANRPWEERQTAIREIQNIYRVDLYLLVKNYEDADSLFGQHAGALGIFQMIEDVKVLLRQSTLTGLIDKTYTEPGGDSAAGGGGPVEFEDVAALGFDSAEYTFVHRARIPYVARMAPFCHAVASPL